MNRDQQSIASAPATDQYAPARRIPDRIADQVAKHRLEEMHVGPHPGTGGHEPELEAGGTRHAAKFRNDPVKHCTHRKVSVLRLDPTRIETSHVEQRVEQIAE